MKLYSTSARDLKWTYFVPTIAICGFAAWIFSSQYAGGYFFLCSIVGLPIWLALAIGRIRAGRLEMAIKSCLWLATIVLICWVHWKMATDARRVANNVVFRAEAFHRDHGSYPQHMSVDGTDSVVATRIWLHYSAQNGAPYLFYQSTFIPFDQFDYDFDKKVWVEYNDD